MFVLKNNNIWESTLFRFFEELDKGFDFHQKLISNFQNKVNYKPSKKEAESWLRWCHWFFNNKQVFLEELDKETSIMIEYVVSRNNSRIDFIVSGKKTKERYGSCIIEMKGWEKVNDMNYRLTLNVANDDYNIERIHPSFSANSYREEIVDWYKNKNDWSLDINSCVLMHELSKNKGKTKLEEEKFAECLQMSPIFYKDDAQNLVKYIKQNVQKKTSKLNEWYKEIVFQPSIKKLQQVASLQNAIEKLLESNKILSSSQKRISRFICDTLKNESTNKNNVFVIQGDAGTGKTIVAIHLALEMIKIGKLFSLQLPGRDFREGIKDMLKRRKLFTNDIDLKGNLITVNDIKNYWEKREGIIIDEAHRLGNVQQINYDILKKFIINQKDKNIILFVDNNQKCSIKSWNVGDLKSLEKNEDIKVYINEDLVLNDQFRYDFSKDYAKWLNNTIRSNLKPLISADTKKTITKISTKGKFRVIDNPENFIKEFEKEVKNNEDVRLLSTYYHKWTKKIQLNNDSLEDLKHTCSDLRSIFAKDIKLSSKTKLLWYPFTSNLNDFRVYINDKELNDKTTCEKYKNIIRQHYKTNNKPLSFLFNPSIGYQCVAYYNTVQGFEFNSIYVYIGKEMIYNQKINDFEYNHEWDREKRVSLDHVSKNSSTPVNEKDKIEILKNQLRVLLTRGKNKVTIYCEDKNTSDYFKKLIID